MPLNRLAFLASIALAGTALAQTAPQPVFTPQAFRAHVEFLGDDLLEGRDTGSRGHEIAARYVASRFDALGLKPAGDNGTWYQRVTFQKTTRTGTPGTVTVTGPTGTQSWSHGTEVLVGLNPLERTTDMSAPVVFVGYGITDKATGIDDYRGLDVKGKIVAVLSGFPKGLPSETGAHLSDTKAANAQAHGAIGVIALATIQSDKARPWAVSVRYAGSPRFTWVGSDGKPFVEAPAIRASATLHGPAAEALFAGAPATFEAIRAEADRDGGRPQGFPLKTSVRIRNDSAVERVTSPNVAAILPGADPKLAAQIVVLSAHLDHIGISPARPGDAPDKDRINNGALDNASGIATMLEVARAAAQAPDKPRRSILFLASTAEEKGLLGADYFARHPTVPASEIVGDVDLDMPLLLYPFTDVTAFGADHSTLGPLVARAVAPMGIKLSPDPMPEQNIFVRSDHYMFVKQGVPAVFLATGYANGGEKAWNSFFEHAYHQPADDLNQPIDWVAGARFAEANYRITRAMADADQSPRWYAGDYFADLFAPGAARAAR